MPDHTPFSLVTFSEAGHPTAGLVVGDRIYSIADALARPKVTVLALLEHWHAVELALVETADALGAGSKLPSFALADAELYAPLLYPGAIYGSGANYVDHLAEMARVTGTAPHDPRAGGQAPWHFLKVPRSTVVGPFAEIALPAHAPRVDWEIELAVVIGTRAKDVGVADALGHVAGYTIANDLSARDLRRRPGVPTETPSAYDWVAEKCFDGACPLGPGLVPARFVADPQDLALELWINDELMQSSRTSQMIFSVAEQIAHLSSRVTLHTGDVILTGTPAGVGMARGVYLKPGDRMRLAITGLGVLENTIAP